jgi:hypothetical protein
MTITNATTGLSPMYLKRLAYPDDPCDGCAAPLEGGDVALVGEGGERVYCFACVTTVYEAMRAARG